MQTDEEIASEVMSYIHAGYPNMIEIQSFSKNKKDRMLEVLLILLTESVKSELFLNASFVWSYDSEGNSMVEVVYDDNRSLDELIQVTINLLTACYEICRLLIGLGIIVFKFRKNSLWGSLGLSFKKFGFVYACKKNNLITEQEYNHFSK